MQLRPDQEEALLKVRSEFQMGRKKVILRAPTGWGKTITAAIMIARAARRVKRVYFGVHRGELVDQASETFSELGIHHGFIAAGYPTTPALVQIVMLPTLSRRLLKVPEPDLFVYDECQHSMAETSLRVINHFKNSYLVGLSATPCRNDGKGLGDVFESIVHGPEVRWLIDNKMLSDFRYFEREPPELRRLKKIGGDYAPDEAGEMMSDDKLVGDMVSQYKNNVMGKLGIAFCANVRSSRYLAERFHDAGVIAVHLDGETDAGERRRIVAAYRKHEIQVLTQVNLFIEGFDVPGAEVCIAARPTTSRIICSQGWGRVMRYVATKEFAYIHDHAGWSREFQYPDTPIDWTLTETKPKEEEDHISSGPPRRTCAACYCIYRASLECCPQCGTYPDPDIPILKEAEGELQEVKGTKDGKVMPVDKVSVMIRGMTKSQRGKWMDEEGISEREKHRRLQSVAYAMGYKPGWASFVQKAWRDKKAKEEVLRGI